MLHCLIVPIKLIEHGSSLVLAWRSCTLSSLSFVSYGLSQPYRDVLTRLARAVAVIELGIPVTDFQPGHTPVTTLWLLLHFALALLVDSIGVAGKCTKWNMLCAVNSCLFVSGVLAAIRKADRTLLFFIICK